MTLTQRRKSDTQPRTTVEVIHEMNDEVQFLKKMTYCTIAGVVILGVAFIIYCFVLGFFYLNKIGDQEKLINAHGYQIGNITSFLTDTQNYTETAEERIFQLEMNEYNAITLSQRVTTLEDLLSQMLLQLQQLQQN